MSNNSKNKRGKSNGSAKPSMVQRKKVLKEMDARAEELKKSTAELSERMKSLLSGDIKEMQKKEKHRAVEMLGIFAKHNFYANGLTPEELRTTLEDLGPTYVKIGQIMSSRVDLLPESYCKELEKLRQNVKKLDPALARAVIEEETGKKIMQVFHKLHEKGNTLVIVTHDPAVAASCERTVRIKDGKNET